MNVFLFTIVFNSQGKKAIYGPHRASIMAPHGPSLMLPHGPSFRFLMDPLMVLHGPLLYDLMDQENNNSTVVAITMVEIIAIATTTKQQFYLLHPLPPSLSNYTSYGTPQYNNRRDSPSITLTFHIFSGLWSSGAHRLWLQLPLLPEQTFHVPKQIEDLYFFRQNFNTRNRVRKHSDQLRSRRK